MRKLISILLVCCLFLMTFTACGKKETANTGSDSTKQESKEEPKTEDAKKEETKTEETTSSETENAEIVDGKFKETRKITVEVYDRGNDGGSKPEDNVYTNYIKEGMLRDHNVEVEFIPVPRWTEVEQINNLLAAGDAPDICVTYDYSTIQTYAGMGGVLDLNTYVNENKDLLPNLWNWLGETNINWDKSPTTGEIWALEAKLAVMNRINTFVRRDWLEKLNLKAPTTLQEFEDMLFAFQKNASTLLGKDADKMIPFSISTDVGWRAAQLIESFMDPDISDKDYYVRGYDDRKFTQVGTKEAIRVLNKWYNAGLIWKDFALYDAGGDSTEDNLMKAGYVGAFMHNWDYPYRSGEDSIQRNLERLVGDNAAYVAVECFQDSKGGYRKFLAGPVDRKIFFPTTNDEPLASLMYLDWLSTPENLQYLQIGEEGVTHEKQADGSFLTLAATGESIMNSPLNIDYTITCNGMNLVDPEISLKSRALSYAGIDSSLIEIADQIAVHDGRIGKNVQVGKIEAEEGLGTSLTEKRDVVYDNAVIATPDKFDQVFDDGMNDYLSSGGQAVMDERLEKWEATYGSATSLPE